MIFQMFLMYKIKGEGEMFKILRKWENIRIWGLLKINMNWIISRQLPDNKKKGASDPISRLAGLCVYLFYPNLFPF